MNFTYARVLSQIDNKLTFSSNANEVLKSYFDFFLNLLWYKKYTNKNTKICLFYYITQYIFLWPTATKIFDVTDLKYFKRRLLVDL